MFIHNFKYALKTLFRDKMLIFWTFAFPIILGTFFNMAFSNIENSEKLEIINLQLLQRNNAKRKMLHWLFISLCAITIITFIALYFLNSPYLNWDYNNTEYAVLGVAFQSFEWLFVRIAPIIFIISIVGIILTRKKD